jgi:hypothetical protein
MQVLIIAGAYTCVGANACAGAITCADVSRAVCGRLWPLATGPLVLAAAQVGTAQEPL